MITFNPKLFFNTYPEPRYRSGFLKLYISTALPLYRFTNLLCWISQILQLYRSTTFFFRTQMRHMGDNLENEAKSSG